ncbi:hypothetical protein B9Z55_022724 [Caenorhabditis nigoni]|uniref:Uncharacterized protein n=1 Tax=Caenorhabditis nigoni TaxID=1611254 RepID=A0A2G5SLM5_9PELO|nr:hypothetical protein B9Z55_022724 [Caenorhabditis nigoni]
MSKNRSKSSGGFDGNRTYHGKGCREETNYFTAGHHHTQHQNTQQNDQWARRSVNSDSFKENSKFYGADGRQPPPFGAGWSKGKEVRSGSTNSRADTRQAQDRGSRDRSHARQFGQGWRESQKENNDGIANTTFNGLSMKNTQGHGDNNSGKFTREDGSFQSQKYNKETTSIGDASYQEGVHSGQYEARRQRAMSNNQLQSNRARVKSESSYINVTGRGASEDKFNGHYQDMDNIGATNHRINTDNRRGPNEPFQSLPITYNRVKSESDARRAFATRGDNPYYHKESIPRNDSANNHHWGHQSFQRMPSDGRGSWNPSNNSHKSSGSRHHSQGYNNDRHIANKSFHSIHTYNSHQSSSDVFCNDSKFKRSGSFRRGSWNHQNGRSQGYDQHHERVYSQRVESYNEQINGNRQNSSNSRARQDTFSNSALGHPYDLNTGFGDGCDLDDNVFEEPTAHCDKSMARETQFDDQHLTVNSYVFANSGSADTKSQILFNKTFGGFDAQLDVSSQPGDLGILRIPTPIVEETELAPMDKLKQNHSTHCEAPMKNNTIETGGNADDHKTVKQADREDEMSKKDWKRKPWTYPYDFNADGWSNEAIRWLSRLCDLGKSNGNLHAEISNEWEDNSSKKLRRHSAPYNLSTLIDGNRQITSESKAEDDGDKHQNRRVFDRHRVSNLVSNTPQIRKVNVICANPTWNHSTLLPKASIPDIQPFHELAGKYIVHSGFVSKFPLLHVTHKTVTYKSAKGALVPMPSNFQYDLIPTRPLSSGLIASGIYEYADKHDPDYEELKTSQCVHGMVRVVNDKPGVKYDEIAPDDEMDQFLMKIRADWENASQKLSRDAN